MNSDLDIAHDWILLNADYSNGELIVNLFEQVSAELSRKATVQFTSVFLYLIAEEAQDSIWNDEFPMQLGFIKKYSTASSHLAKKLDFTAWPFYENSNHFRVITRDDLIHIFCNADPIVTVTTSV